MAKIDITKTELVWPGKYNEDGALKEVQPPFSGGRNDQRESHHPGGQRLTDVPL